MTEPKNDADQKAESLKKKLAEANAKMTDRALADRVRAAHANAERSEEGIDAMLADYERAAEEARRPYGGGEGAKPTAAPSTTTAPAPAAPGSGQAPAPTAPGYPPSTGNPSRQ